MRQSAATASALRADQARVFADFDHVVAHGVNVTTYAMLHTHAAALPVERRRAALVFVDEAHRRPA